MPREAEWFVLAVILTLAAAWIMAFRLILGVGDRWQKIWVWIVTLAVVPAALGLSAAIVADFFGAPRIVTGTVQSLGDVADRQSVLAYQVVLNGRTFWVGRTDYERLLIGERIRGRAGPILNFLDRIEASP